MADQAIAAVANEVEVLVEGNTDNQEGLSLGIDTQPMIALQPFAEPDELVIQTNEDGLEDSQEVPAVGEEHEIASVPSSPKERKKKGKSGKGKSSQGSGKKSFKRSLHVGDDDSGRNEVEKPRKWERKKVQIKTLEGEFAVTMWASGEEFLPKIHVVGDILRNALFFGSFIVILKNLKCNIHLSNFSNFPACPLFVS